MNEMIKQQMAAIVDKVTKQMAEANATCPVSGERIKIPLEGRTLDAVYFKKDENAPMIFAFHGGGYTFGGCALNDELYVALKDALNTNIISVGYRKAPEYKFPVPQQDCYDAVKYLMENSEYQFDRNKVAVFGGSAGAHAALAVTTYAKRNGGPKIGLRLLTYPYGDAVTPPEDKPGVHPMEIPMYQYFNEITVDPDCGIPATDPIASPALATADDLDCAIPTFAVLGEADSLKVDGEKIMKILNDAGCPCECHIAAGMPHGFFEMAFAPEGEDMGFLPPTVAAAKADGSLDKMGAWALDLMVKFWNKYF